MQSGRRAAEEQRGSERSPVVRRTKRPAWQSSVLRAGLSIRKLRNFVFEVKSVFVYLTAWETTRGGLIPADMSVANWSERGEIVGKELKSPNLSVCVYFPSLEDWSFSQCVCARVSLCVLCSPVGLRLINLARFCLCIIPSSVNTTINPRVRSHVTVPLRVKVNTSATCLRQRRGTHRKNTTYIKKQRQGRREGGEGALCRRIRPQNSVLFLPM